MDRSVSVTMPNGQSVPMMELEAMIRRARAYCNIHGKDTATIVSCHSAESAWKTAKKLLEQGWTMEAVNNPEPTPYEVAVFQAMVGEWFDASQQEQPMYRVLLLDKRGFIPTSFTVEGAR